MSRSKPGKTATKPGAGTDRRQATKRPAQTTAANKQGAGETRPAKQGTKRTDAATRAAAQKTVKGKASSAKTAKPRAPRRSAASKATQAEPGTAPAPPLVRAPMTVRWRDLDAFNHVNNAQYLSYLEEARLQWMMGIRGDWIDDDIAPVVAAAHINYRRPIAWPAELVIELFVERLGETSLSIGHRIVAAGDGSVLYADGHVVMVWIGRRDGRPARLPDAVRVACAPG